MGRQNEGERGGLLPSFVLSVVKWTACIHHRLRRHRAKSMKTIHTRHGIEKRREASAHPAGKRNFAVRSRSVEGAG